MASNILSKLLPPVIGSPSVYETLRQYDQSSDQSDLEERAGMALDEENLGAGFQDFELGDALTYAAASRINASTDPARAKGGSRPASKISPLGHGRSSSSPKSAEVEDLDDEVPQSLLIEDGEVVPVARKPHRKAMPPVPGPITRSARAKWQATQEQQRLHNDLETDPVHGGDPARRAHTLGMIDSKEKAMWRWTNVENLDNFLKDVYDYFIGNGIWCILLSRVLNLL